MHYSIICDRPGKLRVRFGQYAFDKTQGWGIEERIKQISGVRSAEATSSNGGLLVRYEGDLRARLLEEFASLRRDSLPIAEPSEKEKLKEENKRFIASVARKAAWHYGKRLFLPATLRHVITLGRAARYFYRGLDALLGGKLNVDVLDASAIASALIQNSFDTASSIMFLLGITDALEEHTRKQTISALEGSLALQVENVWMVTDDGDVKVPIRNIRPGDLIRVQDGAMIPIDGTVSSGEAMVNEASLTGESAAIRRATGHSVYAGTVVEEGNIVISVKKSAGQSRIHDIARMIDESENLKAGVQSRAEELADSIVPFSFAVAAATLLLTGSTVKAMSALMVDYSCALKLSIPIAVVSAIKEATDHSILVKGGKFLEIFDLADSIVFDKTGTLTSASPNVVKVVPLEGWSRADVLRDAACLEEHFPHSVARAIVNKAAEEDLIHDEEHATVEYVVAHGISTLLRGMHAKIGSAHYIFEDEKIPYTDEIRKVEAEEMKGLSVIYFAVDGKAVGLIGIEDPVREGAAETIDMLKKCGFRHILMLTGDGEDAAFKAACELGITEYRSQVLPEDKAEIISELKAKGHKVIMVGDGINDSPALAKADASIAMRDASDLARQVADITLLSEDLNDILLLKNLSRLLMQRIHRNYRFILGFNTLLMAAGITGLMTAGTTSLLHNVSTMLISAASTRPYLNTDGKIPDIYRI